MTINLWLVVRVWLVLAALAVFLPGKPIVHNNDGKAGMGPQYGYDPRFAPATDSGCSMQHAE
jgi:hypothetical protein